MSAVLTFDGVNDNVFLKHIIFAKCLVAGLEDMKMLQSHLAQEQFAKWLEIWPVAETTRRNRYHLTAGLQEPDHDREECSVEVTGLNINLAQQQPVLRVAMNLPIGRIQDGTVVELGWGCEQITSQL